MELSDWSANDGKEHDYTFALRETGVESGGRSEPRTTPYFKVIKKGKT